MEIDETCAEDASAGVQEWYQEVRVIRDLAGRERVVVGRKR
jgi:hypothetical protein